ncbi:MAG: rRNA maturation RNase YbeY [Beijerinckiaceae bacterium]
MTENVHIEIVEPAWRKIRGVRQVVARAIKACGPHFNRDDEPELCVLLCSDARMRQLNRTWRGKDRPTNVLSFPADARTQLGDIAIAYETVLREAAEEGKSVSAHLAHMVVHGSLHLAGFDHESDEEAEEMEMLERRVLASLGYDDPYDEDVPGSRTATRRQG